MEFEWKSPFDPPAYHVCVCIYGSSISRNSAPSVDFTMNWLTEAVLSGHTDTRLCELNVSEENGRLIELALGTPRQPASGLWRRMKEFAVSRGEAAA